MTVDNLISTSIDRLLEYSGSLLIIFDPEADKILSVVGSLPSELGYSEAQIGKMSSMDLYKLVHVDDRPVLDEFIRKYKDSNNDHEPFTLHLRFRSEKGEYRYLELCGVFEENKGPSWGIACLIRDLTNLSETEKGLRERNAELIREKEKLFETNRNLTALNVKLEKRNLTLEETYDKLFSDEEIFRQVAENANDIFWLRDDKEIIYINNQFERIWGRKLEELIENPYKITEWIHPEDRANVEPWVNLENLSSDSPFTEQYRIVKPDGEIRWLWSRIFAVKNKAGKKYRVLGIASDITEQKEFEEALMLAKEKAQESDMLKSSFLANISHEIRTPMNGIIGFAELIAREETDKETRKSYVGIIKKSSEQLVRIIDDIIDFAKLEANQIRIEKANVCLNKMLDQLFTFFTNHLSLIERDAISLLVTKTLSDEKSCVISDEQRLRQVFSHLLDNACKYTPEGFIEFGYHVKEYVIEFFVKDSGIGIPSDKYQLIFEQFRQGDEGHTRKFGGTGLGLPIAKGLVNLLEGNIWVESVPDQGSTFYFTIPYTVEQKSLISTEVIAQEANQYVWRDKLILVAEDDDLNFEYIKVLLEPTQAKIIRAKDGSQAVKICANLNFDIILMDIRLPILNGIQATQRLREMGIDTPVIAQTAFAMDDDEKKCLDAGCNNYMSKPINKAKLYKMIDTYI